MTRLRSSGWSLFVILAVATLGYLLLGCATGWRQERVTYKACDGRTVTAFVRVETSNTPGLDCGKAWLERGYSVPAVGVAMALLPFGCAVRYPDNSEGPVWLVVVPAGPLAGPVWEHEAQHVRGMVHAPGMWFPMWRECE